MAITIGINGFGRIGRVAFRIAINQPEKFKICGINVRNADLDYMIYMIRYDSIFGRFQGSLEKYEDGIVVNGEKIRVYSENDAADIPWGECGAEYIRCDRCLLYDRKSNGTYPGWSKESDHLCTG